jgi:hypothetical protein
MAVEILKKSYLDTIMEMKIILVTEVEVINTIKIPKNSSGCDEISSKIIKQ